MDKKQLAGMMDATILKATATREDVDQLCLQAIGIGAASVCVNPCRVAQVREALQGTPVKVCTVVGFPLGASTAAAKAFETSDAIAAGAREVDMVINIGALKDGDDAAVLADIQAVVQAAKGVPVKVIIETCYLTEDEKVTACRLSEQAGASFVKTSTGFGTGGATAEDVALMKKTVSQRVKVKASGGIRSYEDVKPILAAGADRLGVSAATDILDGVSP